MTQISDYVVSKGVKHPPKTDYAAVLAQLVQEYGFVSKSVAATSSARMVQLPLARIAYNKRHFATLQPREPKGKSLPVVGIVVARGDVYRLIDGHHRFKWCVGQEMEAGYFILLS